MKRPRKTSGPPAEGVSPELLELVTRWLRQTYGSRPLTHHLMYQLEYHLGELERHYGRDETDAAVAKADNRRDLWGGGDR